jgi:hypothetical protein
MPLRALSMLDGTDSLTLRFFGWPKATVTVPEGIGVESGPALSRIQKLVHQQYCALKYGTFSRIHLTKADREATRLDVGYPDPTRMVIDFSRAATAMAAAVQARCDENAPFDATQGGLFGNEPNGNKADESWPRTVREIGLEVIRKVTPAQAATLAKRAIIVAGLAFTSTTAWNSTLKHHEVLQQQANSHQLRLAELNQTRVLAEAGKPASPAANRTVERAIEADAGQLRTLVSSDYAGPFYAFIQSAERARPALLDLARSSSRLE